MKAQFCHNARIFFFASFVLCISHKVFFLPSTEESLFTKIKRNMSYLLFRDVNEV